MLMPSKGRCYHRIASALLLSCVLAGCASTARNTTSVVDYLYPNGSSPTATPVPATPTLTVPVRVGIAFVPGSSGFAPAQRPTLVARTIGYSRGSMLTEAQKINVMQEIANHFRKYPFFGSIDVIPTAYLRAGGSFENLDQLRATQNVDVIMLISYDQTQFTDEGVLSIAYWTLVGAYVIQGEKNDTQTILEAGVYDIPSRKMLFRAPGTSLVKGSATPVNQAEALRKDSETGFTMATRELIQNLDVQLASFRERMSQQPGFAVIRSESSKGDKK